MARRQPGQSTLSVLSAVVQGCQYGFDVIDATGLASWTVYRALARLEGLGLVGAFAVTRGMEKLLYRVIRWIQ